MRAFHKSIAALLAVGSCNVPAPHEGEGVVLFVAARTSPLATGPHAGRAMVADFNRDGYEDIVVPCSHPVDPERGQLAVFLGDGRGAFVSSRIPAGREIGDLALGDMDSDGVIDAMAVRHDSYDVRFLKGDGHGGFRLVPELTVAAHGGTKPHTHAVAAADVNLDGAIDVLTTCADEDGVALLVGDGTGHFKAADGSPFAAGTHPYEGLAVCDMNGDDRPDVVVTNLIGHAVSVLLGDGAGVFKLAAGSPVATARRPGFAAVGDLDGDAHPDVVVTHDDDRAITILLGDGRGGLRPRADDRPNAGQPCWGAAVGDLDGDGHKDLALGGTVDGVFVMRGDGAGGFTDPPLRVPTADAAPGYVTLADMNGDGRLDIVATHFGGGVTVLLAQPTP